MTLKTSGEKVFYWIFTSVAIIAGLVLSIIYTVNTSAIKVILAADDDKVYLVDANYCGKCTSDVWIFYDDKGEIKRVSAPLLDPEYNIIQVYFNKNHFNKKLKTFSLGSYKEVYLKVLNGDGFYISSASDITTFRDQTCTFNDMIFYSFLFWAVISTLLIALPFIHPAPSKDNFTELMRYASYLGYDGWAYSSSNRKKFSFQNGDLKAWFTVKYDEVVIDQIYYKDEKVVHNVQIKEDGSLRNVISREFYWVKRAIKEFLPKFKHKMVDVKIEQLL